MTSPPFAAHCGLRLASAILAAAFLLAAADNARAAIKTA
jgi:hypothetical protein